MKSAAERDARVRVWDRLLTTNPPVRVESIRFVESEVFEEQVIRLGSATCIVGSHGAGKTLLLDLVEAAFGYGSQMPPFVGVRGYNPHGVVPLVGVIEVAVSVGDKMVSGTVDLSTPENSRYEFWENILDAEYWPTFASSADLAQNFLSYYQDLDWALKWGSEHSIPEYRFKASELSALRGILGKKYDAVHMRTVLFSRDEDDWRDHAPYVTATSAGRVGNSGNFSLGELWVYQCSGSGVRRTLVVCSCSTSRNRS
ncbi:hypothetical protein HCB18_26440 [Salinispora arenicola]|nr:hypothetical protein [Salinispora arenicola]